MMIMYISDPISSYKSITLLIVDGICIKIIYFNKESTLKSRLEEMFLYSIMRI